MNLQELIDLGSQTARNGFRNENDIVDKFNNWNNDIDAQKWLTLMHYELSEIQTVEAVIIARQKTDVQVQVRIKLKKEIDVQNLQVKLVSNDRGFNQIDKRRVDKYKELWAIQDDIVILLKKYTGEICPDISTRDCRRMFMDEFNATDRNKIIKFFENEKTLIVSDILKGRGSFSAEWMLVAQIRNNDARWILKPINFVLNYFGNGNVSITPRGCIKIGRITVQRKGGDNGRESAKMLQFKINPAELFDT